MTFLHEISLLKRFLDKYYPWIMNDTYEMAIAEKYFALANDRELDLIPDMLADDIIYSSDTTGVYFGRAEAMEMMRKFFTSFPYLYWHINSIELVKEAVVEIYFTLKMRDKNGDETEKKGVERIIVSESCIKYIEVRNL